MFSSYQNFPLSSNADDVTGYIADVVVYPQDQTPISNSIYIIRRIIQHESPWRSRDREEFNIETIQTRISWIYKIRGSRTQKSIKLWDPRWTRHKRIKKRINFFCDSGKYTRNRFISIMHGFKSNCAMRPFFQVRGFFRLAQFCFLLSGMIRFIKSEKKSRLLLLFI